LRRYPINQRVKTMCEAMPKKPTYEELQRQVQVFNNAVAEREKSLEVLRENEKKLNEERDDLKLKKDDLIKSELNFRRAQRISKIGSWYYDWDSDTEIWSDECFNLYGLKKEDFPDNIVPESVSEGLYENPSEVQDLSMSLAEKHDTYEVEFTTVPINGQVKTMLSYCEVERDENGNLLKVFGTDQDITERVEAENNLRESHAELSTLYKLSMIINESISLDSLLSGVLQAIPEFDIFHLEHKGGIFLIEEEEMVLAATSGHDNEFLELHENIKLGDCLCGLAAQSGEMITSCDCFDDKRHTIRHSSMENHGHIIVPLKSSEGLEGILFLYTEKEKTINDRVKNLFQTIGNQVGMMIRNAKLYEEIKSLSLFDPLTGLANRRMMNIRLNEFLLNIKRNNQIFFIMMLDIDYFKKYNDAHGHDAGDNILIQIGALFKKLVRDSDLVARYGGEEFLIALSDMQRVSVSTIAERIRKTVEQETDVTISLGISCFRNGLELRNVIKEADRALYRAKEQGRNRFVFSDADDLI